MQIEIVCKNGTLRPNGIEHIEEKSNKLLTIFERLTAVTVTVVFEPGRVDVSLQVSAEHRKDFVAHAEDESVFAAFANALHKIEQQLRRYKERIQDHRRDTSAGELPAEVTNVA